MSISDIANSIDDLIRQMHEEKSANIPTVGGDYDTVDGWARRLGVGRGKAQELVSWMGCERRKARVIRGSSYYTCAVVYSPELAKLIADQEEKQ